MPKQGRKQTVLRKKMFRKSEKVILEALRVMFLSARNKKSDPQWEFYTFIGEDEHLPGKFKFLTRKVPPMRIPTIHAW